MRKLKKTAKEIYIGTSGWMYKDWGEAFYPVEMKSGHLPYLAREFNTVEINASFYHLPTLATFKKWRKETPVDFAFSVKLSRYITHHKKLEGIRVPLRKFFNNAKGLGEKLGVVLIQLPPFLKFNESLLKKFLADLKAAKKLSSFNARFALEPRHMSWIEQGEAVTKILAKENVALVFPHSAEIPSFPPEDKNLTADFVYLRLHGPSEFAASRYGARKLAPWAEKIKRWRRKGLTVFVYFNNDIQGHAIYDARTLKKLVNMKSRKNA